MTPVWDDSAADTVASLVGIDGFGECRAMAVVDKKGKFAAGIVFHAWGPDSGVIELSAAAVNPNWPTRNVLKFMFGYVFDDCGCQMAITRTHENNTRVRRFMARLGADEYLIPRLRGRNASEAIQTLTEEQWTASRFAR